MLSRIRGVYAEFPSTFWTLIGATFIDRLGGALLFPFFALYVTERFDVGMTEVGILFALYAIASAVGTIIGGALTDKLGRRWMLIFGLVVSALSSLLMGVVSDLTLFYILAVFVGLLSNTGGPAQQAMVADLVPEEKRVEAYGILRVVINLAVVIGPALGGLLAANSFLWLFILDAVTSLITAVIVFFRLPETKPETVAGHPEESMSSTLRGYATVLKDRMYIAFILVMMLSATIYVQMNSSLSVYLRDEHGVSAQGYGYILSLNAAIVVLFQFSTTRIISKYPPMLMMALGALLYGIGFAMYGFVGGFALFLVAMVIITIGEMVVSPVGQALVAQFAPEDMRGRYMAIAGFSWTIPFAVGPLLAGLIMDNYNPDWVWYFSGILSLFAVSGFLLLYVRISSKEKSEIKVEN